MPTISMFFGIIITMYPDDHNPPHFHARYQGDDAVFTLDGEFIEGDMPRKQRKLIGAWAELHFDELSANWELALNSQELYRIDPLR